MVTPPSTSFETDGIWTTLAIHTCRRVAAGAKGNACEGTSYLTCDGSVRGAGWDGPLLLPAANLGAVVFGHQYAITAAVRYSPSTAPTVSSSVMLTVKRQCATPAGADQYTEISTQLTTYGWVRVSGEINASLPNCTALYKIDIYIATMDAQQSYSLDVDDFRMYDLTPGAGGSGSAGAAGAGSGSAGSPGAGHTGTAGSSG